jgi:hypothetical protein
VVKEIPMHPPIILCLLDTGEVKLFRDLWSLEAGIEAVDVINREYMAFDAVGAVIDLTAHHQWGTARASVSAISGEGILRGWILKNYSSNQESCHAKTLAEMVKVLMRIYPYNPKTRSC